MALAKQAATITGNALIAAAGLAMLAAACSGSSRSHVAQLVSTTTQSRTSTSATSMKQSGALAFSRCMRSHRVQKFPDPVTGDGRLPKVGLDGLGVSSSRFNAADRACRELLPTTGGTSMHSDSASVERCIVAGICLPSVTHWLLNVELRYARCMRSHGVPNWPDPTTDPQGRIDFDVSPAWAASPPEPAHRECAHLTGALIG